MAQRLGADPLMIMQHLYIVDGHPSWSSQFVISAINTCGKFSPLRFKIEDMGEKEAEYEEITGWQPIGNGKSKPIKETRKVKVQNMAFTAWAKEKATGEILEGPTVSMEMAIAEGWYSKTGSKWRTMPDVMLRYRAASFFGKLYAPELLMGLQTAEEVQDKTIVVEAITPEEENPDNSMTMDDVKEQVEKPKRSRKKTTELPPTEESPTVDVTPEPVKEAEPESPQPASENIEARKTQNTKSDYGDIVCPYENSDGM